MKSIDEQAKAIPNTAVLIAETLMNAEVPFSTSMAALTMVLVEIGISLNLEREDIVKAVDEASKIIYEKHAREGDKYVQ